jgi:hypothetical protein
MAVFLSTSAWNFGVSGGSVSNYISVLLYRLVFTGITVSHDPRSLSLPAIRSHYSTYHCLTGYPTAKNDSNLFVFLYKRIHLHHLPLTATS